VPAPPPPRHRRRALALAAAAALALPAAAAAQEPPPAGTLANVEVLTGGDYTLELWRDAASGDIALIDTRQPEGEQVSWVRGTSLVTSDTEDPELFELRHRDRAGLSDSIVSLQGIGLDGVEAALAAGAPAPRPDAVTASLTAEAAIPAGGRFVLENFGSAARALARHTTEPVVWAGPRRFGFRVRQSTLTQGQDDRGRRGPLTIVTYGRGPVAFPGLCDHCFTIATARIGTATARDLVDGRAFTERIAGRPARYTGSGLVIVRIDRLVVAMEDLGPKRTARLVRSLRVIRA
jgi:hypothetical protein